MSACDDINCAVINVYMIVVTNCDYKLFIQCQSRDLSQNYVVKSSYL